MTSLAQFEPPVRGGRMFNCIGRHNIRGYFFSGLTAAVIALPMTLAFGVPCGAVAATGCGQL